MLWFLAGISVGSCLGAIVAGLCMAASGRRLPTRNARFPDPRGTLQTRT